ncbi:anti-CBASS protein Acb1 family protein, partial [Candidatus Erwinia dacicola]
MFTLLGERVAAINYGSTRGDVSDRELLAMYKNSWVVKKFIDKTADDMLKMPREIIGGVPEDVRSRANELENSLNVQGVYREALTWAFLLGDSLIVAITDCDDDAIDTPLALGTEDVIKFLVLSKGEYEPDSKVISDISSPALLQGYWLALRVIERS